MFYTIYMAMICAFCLILAKNKEKPYPFFNEYGYFQKISKKGLTSQKIWCIIIYCIIIYSYAVLTTFTDFFYSITHYG